MVLMHAFLTPTSSYVSNLEHRIAWLESTMQIQCPSIDLSNAPSIPQSITNSAQATHLPSYDPLSPAKAQDEPRLQAFADQEIEPTSQELSRSQLRLQSQSRPSQAAR